MRRLFRQAARRLIAQGANDNETVAGPGSLIRGQATRTSDDLFSHFGTLKREVSFTQTMLVVGH
jgi:hypothetical protein